MALKGVMIIADLEKVLNIINSKIILTLGLCAKNCEHVTAKISHFPHSETFLCIELQRSSSLPTSAPTQHSAIMGTYELLETINRR
jgi:hypothetical protein